MNFIVKIIYFVFLSIVLNLQGYTYERQSIINNKVSTSSNPCLLSSAHDLFDRIATNKNNSFSQHLNSPIFQKIASTGYLSDNVTGLNKKHGFFGYKLFSEYNLTRLEGPDIIHPFNYFW